MQPPSDKLLARAAADMRNANGYVTHPTMYILAILYANADKMAFTEDDIVRYLEAEGKVNPRQTVKSAMKYLTELGLIHNQK